MAVIDVQISDSRGVRRRVRLSTGQTSTRVSPYLCGVPLRLPRGREDEWVTITLDLADVIRRAYGTEAVELVRIEVHAQCRLFRLWVTQQPMPLPSSSSSSAPPPATAVALLPPPPPPPAAWLPTRRPPPSSTASWLSARGASDPSQASSQPQTSLAVSGSATANPHPRPSQRKVSAAAVRAATDSLGPPRGAFHAGLVTTASRAAGHTARIVSSGRALSARDSTSSGPHPPILAASGRVHRTDDDHPAVPSATASELRSTASFAHPTRVVNRTVRPLVRPGGSQPGFESRPVAQGIPISPTRSPASGAGREAPSVTVRKDSRPVSPDRVLAALSSMGSPGGTDDSNQVPFRQIQHGDNSKAAPLLVARAGAMSVALPLAPRPAEAALSTASSVAAISGRPPRPAEAAAPRASLRHPPALVTAQRVTLPTSDESTATIRAVTRAGPLPSPITSTTATPDRLPRLVAVSPIRGRGGDTSPVQPVASHVEPMLSTSTLIVGSASSTRTAASSLAQTRSRVAQARTHPQASPSEGLAALRLSGGMSVHTLGLGIDPVVPLPAIGGPSRGPGARPAPVNSSLQSQSQVSLKSWATPQGRRASSGQSAAI